MGDFCVLENILRLYIYAVAGPMCLSIMDTMIKDFKKRIKGVSIHNPKMTKEYNSHIISFIDDNNIRSIDEP